MDSVTREIRQVLLGNVVTEGKYLTVSSGRLDGLRYGVTDGADTVVLRGVMRHTKYFQSNLAKGKIKDIAHKAMMDIGRKVVLKSNPDAEAIGPVAHILIHMADGGSAQLYIKVISQQITGDHQFLTVNGAVHFRIRKLHLFLQLTDL